MSNLERGLWLVDQVNRLNACVIAHLEGPVDRSALRQALDILQKKHPLLGTHIVPGDWPHFESEGTPPLPLIIDERRDDQHWQESLYEEMNRKFENGVVPLMRTRVVISPERADIILTFHHVIADGRAVMTCLQELLELAERISRGEQPEADRLPEQPPIDTYLVPTLRTLRGLRLAAVSLARVLWTLFVRTPHKLPDDAPAALHERRSRTLHRIIDPELAKAIARRSKHEQTTVQGALCAALFQSMAARIHARMQKARAITLGCLSPFDLRQMFGNEPIQGMGFYAAGDAIAGRVAPDTAFWDLARSLQRGLHARKTSREVCAFSALQAIVAPPKIHPMVAARASAHRFWGSGAVTNLGVVAFPESYGNLRVLAVHAAGAVSAYGNFFAVAAATFRQQMILNMTYTEPLLSAESAHALAEDVLGRLSAQVYGQA